MPYFSSNIKGIDSSKRLSNYCGRGLGHKVPSIINPDNSLNNHTRVRFDKVVFILRNNKSLFEVTDVRILIRFFFSFDFVL